MLHLIMIKYSVVLSEIEYQYTLRYH